MRDRRGLLGVPGPNPSRPTPHPLPIFPPAASPLVGSSSLRPLHPAAGSVDPGAGIRAAETGPAPRLCPWSLTRSGLVLGVLGGGAASPGKPRSPRPDPQLLSSGSAGPARPGAEDKRKMRGRGTSWSKTPDCADTCEEPRNTKAFMESEWKKMQVTIPTEAELFRLRSLPLRA